jgi:DNA-binding NarL/FixJ family response regulator
MEANEGWPGIASAAAGATIRAMRRSVLLVDDHASFRAEARALLEAAGHEVVGEAADGAAALREAERLRPDAVLLDIGLPDRSGLDLVRPLRSASPGAVLVLVSARPASDYGDRLGQADADAFLDKASLSGDTLETALSDGQR